MAKKFYISDYHFFHSVALRMSRSDLFDTVENMNEEIIRRHNSVVRENDNVYILGDIIVCEEDELDEKLAQTVGRLNGRLHLITGNHDYKYIDNPKFRKYFESISESKLIRDNNKFVQLYHYPVLMWYKKHKGAYHVFGHMHDEKISSEYNILKNEKNAFNACVEVNNFTPCTLDELIENNRFFYNRK